MTILRLALLTLCAAAPAAAQDGARAAPPVRTASIIVYGNDPCPKGAGDEIVVCARRPEAERFRIPAPLRRPKFKPGEQSWVARARDIDETGRAQRPDSCSPNGSGGQTGCTAALLRQYSAERRAEAAAAADVP